MLVVGTLLRVKTREERAAHHTRREARISRPSFSTACLHKRALGRRAPGPPAPA